MSHSKEFIKYLLSCTSTATAREEAPQALVCKSIDANPNLINDMLLTALDAEIGDIRVLAQHSDLHARSYAVALADFAWALDPVIYERPVCARLAARATEAGLSLLNPDDPPVIRRVMRQRLANAWLASAPNSSSPEYLQSISTYKSILASETLDDFERSELEIATGCNLLRWFDKSHDSSMADFALELLTTSRKNVNWEEHPELCFDCIYGLARIWLINHSGTPWENLDVCDRHCSELVSELSKCGDNKKLMLTNLLRGSCRIKQSLVARHPKQAEKYLTSAVEVLSWVMAYCEQSDDLRNLTAARVVIADAYSKLGQGKSLKNLRRAISETEKALAYFEKTEEKRSVLTTIGNLGGYYMALGDVANVNSIDNAISCYKSAVELAVELGATTPEAEFLSCLGKAFAARKSGSHDETIEVSIKYFSRALELLERGDNRQFLIDTLDNFASTLVAAKKWEYATRIYRKLIDSFELLCSETVDDSLQRELRNRGHGFYRSAIEALINSDCIEEAWLYCVMGKNRLAVEFFHRREDLELNTLIQQAQINKLADNYQTLLDMKHSDNRDPAYLAEREAYICQLPTLEGELRRRREELQQHLVNSVTPPPMNREWFEERVANARHCLKDNATTLLDWFMLPTGRLVAFSISPNGSVRHQLYDKTTYERIMERYHLGPTGYFQNDNYLWRTCLSQTLQSISDELQLTSLLPCDGFADVASLIIIPYGPLNQIPMHALSLSGRAMSEIFAGGIGYSTNVANVIQFRAKSKPNRHIAATMLGNDNGLIFASIERDFVARFWSQTFQSKPEDASLNLHALEAAEVVHVAGHGYLGFMDAGINVNDKGDLTHVSVMGLDLRRCAVAILCACEAALGDQRNSSGDNMNLADAFLAAGATSVVAPLWTVDDFSTLVLMTHFYESLSSCKYWRKLEVAKTLARSQSWLRNLTVGKLRIWLIECVRRDLLLDSEFRYTEDHLGGLHHDYALFSEPYYWAVFSVR